MINTILKHRSRSWILILLLASWGCQGTANEDAVQSDSVNLTKQVAPAEPSNFCYAYVSAGDTIQVQLSESSGGEITGFMRYQLKEKDKNTGTLTGKKEGGLILANYQFQSEGMTSSRQVAFQQTDSTLTEGFGAVVVEKDIQKFKDPKHLNFQHSMVLKTVDCGELNLSTTSDL